MTQPEDVHFLHEHHGLTALIRPVVHGVHQLCFGPGDAVYAVDEAQVLHRVHPAMGAEVLGEGPVALGIGADRGRCAVVRQEGGIQWWDRSGEVVGRSTHRFVSEVDVAVVGGRTLVVGRLADGSCQLLVYDGERRVLKVLLPEGARVRPDREALVACWASDRGLETLDLRSGQRFSGQRAAGVRLVITPGPVVGLGSDGLVVFGDGEPELVPERGLTRVVGTPDGAQLLAGSAGGELLVLSLSNLAHPARLVAHEEPVSGLAVDRKGRMVASAAESLVLWGLDP